MSRVGCHFREGASLPYFHCSVSAAAGEGLSIWREGYCGGPCVMLAAAELASASGVAKNHLRVVARANNVLTVGRERHGVHWCVMAFEQRAPAFPNPPQLDCSISAAGREEIPIRRKRD